MDYDQVIEAALTWPTRVLLAIMKVSGRTTFVYCDTFEVVI